MMLVDFDAGAGLQYVTDDKWIPALGIRYKLGVDGLNLWLIALTTLRLASAVWLVRAGRARGLFALPHRARRDRRARRVPARRTSRCSSCSST